MPSIIHDSNSTIWEALPAFGTYLYRLLEGANGQFVTKIHLKVDWRGFYLFETIAISEKKLPFRQLSFFQEFKTLSVNGNRFAHRNALSVVKALTGKQQRLRLQSAHASHHATPLVRQNTPAPP